MPEPAVLAAAVTALASAAGFALSTSLQHRAACAVSETVRGPVQLLRRLALDPLWLLGMLASAAALALHAIALRFGAIALVQPLMVAGVVLAVPVRAALDRRRASRAELTAVTIAASGLAVFLVLAEPEPGMARLVDSAAIAFTLCGLVVAASATAVAYRWMTIRVRAFMLGAAAGVLFGLTAGLLKLVGQRLDTGSAWTLAGDWSLWALVTSGCCGLAINQYAYRIAPLSVSMPMVNVVDVIVALLFGWVVFDEVPSYGLPSLVTQACALGMTAVGLRRIASAWELRNPLDDLTAQPAAVRSCS